MKHYIVVAAIIENNGKFLCVQRDKSKFDYISYKYEFPGGKIEIGETPEKALTREISEELNIDITVGDLFVTIEHQYPDFALTMQAFLCHANSFTLKLTEHIDYKWLKADELDLLDWAGADIPIVEKLKLATI
jgi:8-oxo-dGTP diphosphatase